jgi:hypothetical protein
MSSDAGARLYQIRTEPVFAGAPPVESELRIGPGSGPRDRARFAPARLYQIRAEPPALPPEARVPLSGGRDRLRHGQARLYQVRAEPVFSGRAAPPPPSRSRHPKESLLQALEERVKAECEAALAAGHAVAALQHRTREALLRELIAWVERSDDPKL